jgi:hypothetical protein
MGIYFYLIDIDLIQKENNSDLSVNPLIAKDDNIFVILRL